MKWFRRARPAAGAGRPVAEDAEVARLTERADLIVDELADVVKQLNEAFKASYGKES